MQLVLSPAEAQMLVLILSCYLAEDADLPGVDTSMVYELLVNLTLKVQQKPN